MTNSSGVVAFTLVDTSAETVTVSATDTTDLHELSSTVSVTFTSGAADGSVSTVIGKPDERPSRRHDGIDHHRDPLGPLEVARWRVRPSP